MKKSRFLSLILVFALVLSISIPCAGAYQSDIVDSMHVEAKAALLVDMDTGLIMYEQNAYDRMYPASITKVMTALLVVEAIEAGELSLDQMITATRGAWQGLDWTSSNQNIQAGEEMSVKDLLYCLMVASANESANIFAIELCGSIEAFADRMNQRAAEIGCTGTNFVNPHGMPDDNHYTTAYDLYLIAQESMQHKLFQEVVSCDEYYTEPTNKTDKRRHFYNTNGLLSKKKYSDYYYEYCTGIKTGTTNAAGYCLLSSAEKDGQRLICVMLGCENPVDANGNTMRMQFIESVRLLSWGYDSYSVHSILDATHPIAEVPVTLSSECDYVSVVVDGTLEAQLPNDITSEDFDWTYELPESVEAPVKAGQKLGSMTISLDGETYGTVDLVAVNSVSRSELLATQQKLSELVQSWQFIAVVSAIVLLLLVLIIRARIIAKRRRSYHGRRSNNYKG